MPVKKTKAAAPAKASKTSAMPKASLPKKPRFLPPQPLQVETQIATATTPTLLLGVGMICAVLVGVAFGASLLNAAASVARTFYGESNESKNVFDVSRIRNYEEYKRLYSDASKAKFFNVNVKSKAVLGNKSFTDQCFKDTCDSSGRCVSKAVTSCLPSDKNCYLKEGFIIATPLKLGSWEYDCQFGCKNGACAAKPVCTDSDLSSDQTFPYISGQSDPFMKGSTSGLLNGIFATAYDTCYNQNELAEYYCNNGQVVSTGITCENGCSNGACQRLRNYPVITISSLPTNQLMSGYQTLAVFSIAAVKGDISWKKINFKYISNKNLPMGSCRLYNKYGSDLGGFASPSDGNIEFSLVEQLIIKDQAATYLLKCSIEPTAPGTVLSLAIDGKYSSSTQTMTYDGISSSGEKRFIWSDRSALPHVSASKDWHGSNGVNGLPSDYWTLTN